MSAVSSSFPRAADPVPVKLKPPIVIPAPISPEQKLLRDVMDLMVQMSSVIDGLHSRVKVIEKLVGERAVARQTAHEQRQVV